MTEEKKSQAPSNFDQQMKESSTELVSLKTDLQNLMVKFGLRALKTYQAARTEPLRPAELASLVKYELQNAITDFSEPNSLNSAIKQTITEWQKQQETT
jgi:hypothetical protein